ncbi:hypothetical protein FOZ60_003617 [Perkinsus olseni]|uniref:Uncharacterized protein n=1 Tax=Perkinsus olseni TaxID=32597 RepID=A0A7J6NVR3_PEROL|nr:hypothetical protein FOZ60_003617 [Perkinsus olseni]
MDLPSRLRFMGSELTSSASSLSSLFTPYSRPDDQAAAIVGSPDIPSKGNGTVKVTITSDTAFDISASWTPTNGTEKSGSETGVPYKYDASTSDLTVTDTTKLQDLINKIGAPLKASDLAKLHYDGKDLHVVNLDNFALTPC